MRIVIAQKILFSGRYALRHVIMYNRTSDSISLEASLQKGYLNFAITKTDIKIIEDDERCVITIEIPASVLTKNQYIRYRTSGTEYYNAILSPVHPSQTEIKYLNRRSD